MPETNDSDEDDDGTLLGKTLAYKRQVSPQTIDEHLKKADENMVHFKALAKHYGVASFLVNMP